MGVSIYKINKGVNRSIEFKGLKAQYIWYLGAGAITLMSFFAAMYIAGISQWICIGVTACLSFALTRKIYSLSSRYGEHGMMKMLAGKNLPSSVKCRSRRDFFISTGKSKGIEGRNIGGQWKSS
jgi:hypothetical protein